MMIIVYLLAVIGAVVVLGFLALWAFAWLVNYTDLFQDSEFDDKYYDW